MDETIIIGEWLRMEIVKQFGKLSMLIHCKITSIDVKRKKEKRTVGSL